MELALVDASRNLEIRVSQRTVELAETRRTLEFALEAAREVGTIADIGERKALENLRSSAENLLVVVDDILDFSKIEAGRRGGGRQSAGGSQGDRITLRRRPSSDAPDAGWGTRVRQILLNLLRTP